MAIRKFTITNRANGKSSYVSEALGASDTTEVLEVGGVSGLAGAIQFVGSFGGTLDLKGSIDGVTYYTIKDVLGNNISVTSAGMYEFATAALFLQVVASAGVSNTVVHMVLRA